MFDKIPNVHLKQSYVKLLNYDRGNIKNVGKCKLLCKTKNISKELEFYVVPSGKLVSPAILGLEH